MWSRLALAPVARITLWATGLAVHLDLVGPLREIEGLGIGFDQAGCPSARLDFIRSISSGPRIPSGKPGKFSTWVVVIS